MKINFISVFFAVLFIFSCNSKDEKFLIANNRVGVLSKNTPIEKLDSIYAKDSVVNSVYEGELRYANTERILIFEKGGKQLLEITPTLNDKQEKIIESVQVLDPRFATEKGISLSSTYKDVKAAYPNFTIEQTFKSVVIIPEKEQFYFTIDKSNLNATNFGLTNEITKEDIQDEAVLSRITISWDF